jgi:hypothetical protein
MSVAIEDFYRDSDGNDWLPAIMRAQDSWQAVPNKFRGFTLNFGARTYSFSDTIQIVRIMTLMGSGGSRDGQGTIFEFPDGKIGIICRRFESAVPAHPGEGDSSVIEKIRLFAKGKTIAGAHGIQMEAAMVVNDVTIEGFSGNGIHIVASLGFVPRTSASLWQITNTRVAVCGGDGVYVRGGDANAGYALGLDCRDNAGWGVRDVSFLGNTYVACHTINNKKGSYFAGKDPDVVPPAVASDVNSTLFLNCYAEDGQVSHVEHTCMVLGGRITADAGALCLTTFDEHSFPNSISGHSAVNGKAYASFRAGSKQKDIALEICYTDPANFVGPLRLHFGKVRPGWWEFVSDNLTSLGCPLRLSTSAAAEGAAQVWFENGFFVGFIPAPGAAAPPTRIRLTSAAAKPTAAGTLGDQVWNAKPVVGGPIGWVFADNGQGVLAWHPFGTIAP